MAESVSSQSLVLGRYQLTDRVGTGSSGSVFAATDSRTGSEVVVKFFDGDQDGFPSWTSELRLVMRFKHPNIVPCLDAGFDEVHKLWALVFARAHGGSLRRALVAGTLQKEQHAQVLLNVAAALAYAHGQGVIHRDGTEPDLPSNSACAGKVGKNNVTDGKPSQRQNPCKMARGKRPS